MPARIKDVASLAGVSTATVSHVINNTRYVSDEIKRKVNMAMQELDYMPNPAARSLRLQKSNIIGLIVPIRDNDSSHHFFMSIANGIESVLKKSGYHLFLSNSMEDPAEELERIKVFNTQLIEGLIIAPTSELGSNLETSPFGKYPVVYIDRKPAKFESDCVLVNGYEGSYQGMKLMLEKGHRRIGFISGELSLSSTLERYEAYRQALQEYGLPLHQHFVKESNDISWQQGYQLAEELVKEHQVTALFVANNTMCMGAIRYLREQKIKIPEDFGVLCYDDYEWTEVMNPALTVVKQPAYKIGVQAAQLLLKRIASPKKKSKEYLLPSELIIRNSI